MRFARSTPYKSPKGAIYVVYTARMRFTRCTPYKSPKGAIYVDSNANYAVHTAQLAQGPCLDTLIAPFRGPSQGPLVTIEPK